MTVEIKRERFLAMTGGDTVNVPVNSVTMAANLGVTARTIKRDLKALQEAGMVRRENEELIRRIIELLIPGKPREKH